jgi:hypothetical protein
MTKCALAGAMLQPKIFFLHNPKAGGTALRSMFATLSGGSVAPVFGNAPNDHRAGAAAVGGHAGYDYYAGHYGHEIFATLGDGHLLVTNFRDPVQRIYSIYRYWRNNVSLDALSDAHPGDVATVRLAQDLSFSDFIRVESDDLKLYISNFHFRQIHRSGWGLSSLGPVARWAVRRRIRGMAWFYIAELPEASTLLLRYRFGGGDLSVARDNRSGGEAEAVRAADAEHLIAMNLLDYEIYGYAVKLQAQRLGALLAA